LRFAALGAYEPPVIEKYKGFDLNLFVVFDALLRHGSVSRTAIELGRSQSAISHALGRLREHFGDELFIKTHEGVIPTERARELQSSVESFVEHAERALLRQAAFDPATSSRRIILNLSDLGEIRVLPPLRARIEKEAPNCVLQSVSLWGEELERRLAEGDIDLVITGPLKLSANIQQQKLFDHPWVVIAPPSLAIEDPIGREEFEAHGQIAVVPTASDKYTVDGLLEREGVRRRTVISTPHFLGVPHIVAAAGDCIAVVPEHLADLHRDAGLIKVLRFGFPMPPIEVHQYWHRRANRDPFNMWLRGVIRQLVSGATASP
jgi:DNA-binding transcriptional LysR family regulator